MQKCYKLFDLVNHVFFICRDVIFQEETFPYKQSPTTSDTITPFMEQCPYMYDSDYEVYPILAQLHADTLEDYTSSTPTAEISDNSIPECGVSLVLSDAPLAEESQYLTSPHCLAHVDHTQAESSSAPNPVLPEEDPHVNTVHSVPRRPPRIFNPPIWMQDYLLQ